MNGILRRSAISGLVASMLVCPQYAEAHARSESYSNWRIDGGRITAVVTVAAGEVASLVDLGNAESLDTLFAAHLLETTAIESVSGNCSVSPPNALRAARGFLRVELLFDCQSDAPAIIRYRALMDRLPAHVHFARIHDNDTLLAEKLFTDRADSWRNDVTTPRGHTFGAFLDLGLRHILGGIDHIAFLLGMLLVAGTFGRGVAAVTGFTLGHSVSLAAAVLGYVQADGRLVEAFIGFTVALVAVEYFLLRRSTATGLAATAMLCAWLTGAIAVGAGIVPAKAAAAYFGFGAFAFCYLLASSRIPLRGTRLAGAVLFTATTSFGLIHGFGFAGFLMETGLYGDSLLLPLLGFNIGVEVGQLALLAIAFTGVWLLRETPMRRLAPVVAAGLCSIGVFWFVSRSLAV